MDARPDRLRLLGGRHGVRTGTAGRLDRLVAVVIVLIAFIVGMAAGAMFAAAAFLAGATRAVKARQDQLAAALAETTRR